MSAGCRRQPEVNFSSQAVQKSSQIPDTSANSDSTVAEPMIGGFTMDQLESKVGGITSFSKMAILLFRFLFKEEEYAGKSLTGGVSKSGEKRRPGKTERNIPCCRQSFPACNTGNDPGKTKGCGKAVQSQQKNLNLRVTEMYTLNI
ncbi:hypothetical protein DPMN_068412 [Dreissena polymorpha]|uniref:Uncharacterized protein n=1 Tax=Dreissena polymorpha TaxID=45954 RepID=A0A9D3YX37_DREPO|nr:hypothetical protein DPMN_068412 [Dreissena polymorpha]